VTEITENSKVRYLARGSKWKGTWSPGSTLSNPPTLAKFAADVARQVPCDYDKDYPEKEPKD
jgi:hypothetical protein